jgi:hypothetical protein
MVAAAAATPIHNAFTNENFFISVAPLSEAPHSTEHGGLLW